MRKYFLFLLLIAVVLVSGCVSYGNQSQQQPPVNQTPSTGAAAIKIQDFEFHPQEPVKVGTTITWTNMDSVQHTVTSDSGAFDSGQLSTAGSFSHTFSTAGTFSYHCSNHPSMKGIIIVEQ